MDESAIQRFILRRCLRNAPSYLISATYRICHLEKFSTWNKFSSRTHTSTTSSVLIGCSGFWSGERRQSGSTDPLALRTHVYHKLVGYRWNLVDRFTVDLIFVVTEITSDLSTKTARLRLKNGFALEIVDSDRLFDSVLCTEATFRVTTAVLEHCIPCLGFAVQETAHVNVWKNRLTELGLPVGPWLRELKPAIIENKGDGGRRSGAPRRLRRGGSVPTGKLERNEAGRRRRQRAKRRCIELCRPFCAWICASSSGRSLRPSRRAQPIFITRMWMRSPIS
jgi:hypothetical protein